MENSSISRRQNRILKHVIEEYVVSAQPVSSEVVVRKYEPKVSSATVRNDMAALQDAGLLDHPHSSAGGGAPVRRASPHTLGFLYKVPPSPSGKQAHPPPLSPVERPA